MDNLIFYYSGTGNSLYDAISIGKSLKNVKLISMRHIENSKLTVSNCKTVGFVFPVHHFGIPETVKGYIKKLAIHNVSYIYAVITCSSWSGNTLHELSKLLEVKGCKLNYTALHENVNSNITSIFETAYNISQNVKAENQLEKIVQDIDNRKKNKVPGFNLFKQIPKRICRKWLNRRKMLDKNFFVAHACRRCGICKEVCGRKNIRMSESGPQFLHKCDECLSCIQYCPYEAINLRRETEYRKRYHHPFVSCQRIAKAQIIIENGSIIE